MDHDALYQEVRDLTCWVERVTKDQHLIQKLKAEQEATPEWWQSCRKLL